MRRRRNPKGDPRRKLGQLGEDLVARDLLHRGYRIEKRNERIAGVELDILAQRRDTLALVEVKTVRAPRLGETMLSPRQAARLHRAARELLCKAPRKIRWVQILIASVRVHVADFESEPFVLGKNAELRYFRLSNLDDEAEA